MSKLNNIGQKIVGKAQQIKGRVEIASGKHLKGNIDKTRGKINVISSDIKMKVD